MKQQIEALRDFLRRYRQAFAEYWSIRHQLDPKPRSEDELAFLPAHLELTDSPVSPLPRWSMRVIVALCLCMFLWALIGQLDIVAVAGGKTVSGGRTKIIQPLEPSVVKAIHVRDGQLVKAGQLLIELDATAAGADNRKAGDALETARLAAARYQALLAALDNGRLPQLEKLDGVDPAKQLSEETLAVGQWRAYQAKREALQATLRQREAELSTTRQQVRKLQGTARLAEAREHDYQELLDKNFISRHAYLDKQQARIEQQGDLASQQSRIQELAAAIAGQREELQALTANFRSDALGKLREAREQASQSGEEMKKTGRRQALTQLTAPVSGSVQQLAIHTVGGVVTEAQPLLAVVPANETLEVEAQIENKDIGFVRPGQAVTVKVESFPYTRYGYLDGVVETVSHDAQQDEKRGLLFPARIRLKQGHLLIDGARVNLSAGMAVSAEIKTGKRRVIDYFLSPLQEHIGEGMRER
ncbi:HlyD family type I secretion periplasmic adaptor subunit [Chromobacterium subtsugae]|uniref:Membrane fusion protein (MFP) family protein n=1 Tax=Chromobacterium subtsugae TaxID=251747 RepID=A0ABS7FK00_9NEIS|nr:MULTISPECIES: HlyD family type I secretion periplasmic adaptor subunit [Chromobacterium]KUM02861.1 hemolysin secretion protein D [Chromobacterium subtsugae]KZE87010.1 hemolysin secretion protein D [Chromobacterium sp. F49]MBW7568598.1 HlyD family type I secretion periplasmic adaptor subunit [Chromobacterium subtsugae]MBW8290382.1 HlyD family type I secretion periplasmic adaptor subunit [Chromobacterium subtsugae]WSE93584.1 HlyD family type I secretion periplasmic adaptor subunit [Chromobact